MSKLKLKMLNKGNKKFKILNKNTKSKNKYKKIHHNNHRKVFNSNKVIKKKLIRKKSNYKKAKNK
jgi:hypothetical protein